MVRTPESKIVSLAQLRSICDRLRESGKRIVTTNGCFDLLHWGHLSYLNQARALGDCLVVGVNADASVRGLKGPDRPLNSQDLRCLALAAVEAVDYVMVFEQATPEPFLEQLKPAIHAKGGDYTPDQLPERKVVEKNGGKVVCLPLIGGLSTTRLMERIKTSSR